MTIRGLVGEAPTNHKEMLEWIEKSVELFQPDAVRFCDGSDEEWNRLAEELVDFSRERRENTMTERLMNEILDASNGLGAAVKRREDMHRMAESNKAFAHYRW